MEEDQSISSAGHYGLKEKGGLDRSLTAARTENHLSGQALKRIGRWQYLDYTYTLRRPFYRAHLGTFDRRPIIDSPVSIFFFLFFLAMRVLWSSSLTSASVPATPYAAFNNRHTPCSHLT